MIDNRVSEDRETSLEEIMEIIKGPDFPTGATILGKTGHRGSLPHRPRKDQSKSCDEYRDYAKWQVTYYRYRASVYGK